MVRRGVLYVLVCALLAGVLGHPLTTAAQPEEKKSDTYTVPKSRQGKQPPAPQDNRQPPAQTEPAPAQTAQPPAAPRTEPVVPSARPPAATPQDLGSIPTATSPAARPGDGRPPVAGAPANVAERVLHSKFGSEGLRNFLGQMENRKTPGGSGQGAPSADTWFDRARPRGDGEDAARPQGTPVFQGGSTTTTTRTPQQAIEDYRNSGQPAGPRTLKTNPVPSPTITNTYRPATAQEAQEIRKTYKSIPGGVVLEGVATGLGEIRGVRYESRFNALMLDDRAVYFMKVPRLSVAILCEAIAADEKVGVSLGRAHLVYGAVPPDSDVAMDLKLADHFLGDIVFARKQWTAGYRYANGYQPQANEDGIYSVAVFFNFNAFQFRIEQEEVQLAGANFDVRLVPLSNDKSAEGGHLPDFDAISKGRVSRQYERNARHVAESIGHYRQERIIDRAFAYGEVAAFLRGLKAAGVDLRELARDVLADRPR
jgi:hypothetical protein